MLNTGTFALKSLVGDETGHLKVFEKESHFTLVIIFSS